VATTTFSCAPDNTSDATFRAWVSALITALTTVGMVQTADTGQINVSTVTRPTATATSGGYAILRFNDAAQATYPLYLKIEFGTASNSSAANSMPQVWLTIGKGSDGAGNISSALLPRAALGPAASGTATPVTTSLQGVASGGAGWVALVPWLGYSNTGAAGTPLPWFVIERSPDGSSIAVSRSNPATTSNLSVGLNSAGNSSVLALPTLTAIAYGTAAATVGTLPVVVPYTINGTTLSGSTSLAAGSIGPVLPWIVLAPALAPWQCINALSYPGGDAPGAAFQTTLGGTTRTYYPIPLSDAHCGMGVCLQPGATTVQHDKYIGLAIRWE